MASVSPGLMPCCSNSWRHTSAASYSLANGHTSSCQIRAGRSPQDRKRRANEGLSIALIPPSNTKPALPSGSLGVVRTRPLPLQHRLHGLHHLNGVHDLGGLVGIHRLEALS